MKFCGLVRPDDVRAAASLGADAIGLVFYPKSSRLLDLDGARAVRAAMPSWLISVGLFVNAQPDLVRSYSSQLGLDVVQLHGDETAEQCENSHLPGQPYWRAVRMREKADLIHSWQTYQTAEYFVLDAFSPGYGGSGHRFDWSQVPAGRGQDLIVSGGLDDSTVGDAITALHPVGVDVSTGIQGENPRIKDAARMEQFIAAVASADAANQNPEVQH